MKNLKIYRSGGITTSLGQISAKLSNLYAFRSMPEPDLDPDPKLRSKLDPEPNKSLPIHNTGLVYGVHKSCQSVGNGRMIREGGGI